MRARQKDFLLHPGAAAEESSAVWTRLEALPAFRGASTVLFYMSMPGEPLTDGFAARWYGRKRLAVPLVVGERLELREYDPLRLTVGYKGIREPAADTVVILPRDVDLAVVPGVAFAPCAQGAGFVRLGHGGGFYDRLLPELSCPLVGVGYSFRLLDSLPEDPWDMRLDTVLLP